MRSPTPLFPVIVAKLLGGSGGGGSVTAAAVLSAMQAMSNAQAEAALAAIDGEPEKLTVTVTESGGVFSSDKTHAEIKASYDAGKTVEAVYDGHIFRLVECGSAGADFIYFIDDLAEGNVFEQYLGVTSANAWTHTARTLIPAPIQITCTMTSETGGTWSGATFAELQAACADGRLLNANVVGVANVTAFMQDFDAGTAVGTSPFMMPSGQYGLVILFSTGNFTIRYLVTPDPTVVTDLSSTSIVLGTANASTTYNYGELTALTIMSIDNLGEFSITFTSGSTPTVLTVPNTMIMPDGFAVEANTRYEINCKDGYALCAGWAVSA